VLLSASTIAICYRHFPHTSMRSRVYVTVERPRVRSFVPAINSRSDGRQVCCWAPCGQDVSIDSCRRQLQVQARSAATAPQHGAQQQMRYDEWLSRPTGAGVKVRSPCPRLYIAVAVMINTTVRGEVRTWVLSHRSLSLDLYDLRKKKKNNSTTKYPMRRLRYATWLIKSVRTGGHTEMGVGRVHLSIGSGWVTDFSRLVGWVGSRLDMYLFHKLLIYFQ